MSVVMEQGTKMTPFTCAYCHQPVMERYLMKVLDKPWHVHCVKCSDCQSLLSEVCFSRDSKLYCRNDFFKRYGTRCAGCNVGLCPEDLVRRAVNKVYHVHCFICSLCRKQLSSGEQLYLVQGERFLCEHCYKVTTQAAAAAAATPTIAVAASAPTPKPADTPLSGALYYNILNPMTDHWELETTEHVTRVAPPRQTDAHLTLPALTPSPSIQLPSNSTSDSKKHKTRTSINPQQLEVLLQTYSHEQKPSKQMREDLMAKTGLDMKVIQVWFQNRRSKEKRDASYREALKEEPSSMTVSQPVLQLPAGFSLPTGLKLAAQTTASSEGVVPSAVIGTTAATLQ